MKLIAHRGFSSEAPENTIASFQLAVKSGFNIIEFDVQLSKDNVPVIFHDETLERTTNGNGQLKNLKKDELKLLDAGIWFEESFSGEKIPYLDQILKIFSGIAHFQIELKSTEPNLAKIVLNSLKNNKWRDNNKNDPYSIPGFSLTSFHFKQVIAAKTLAPEVNVGWLINKENHEHKLSEFLLDHNINMYIPNVSSKFWDDIKLKDSLKKNRITLCAWGAKTLTDVKKMKVAGAEAMTVDWPEEAKKII